MEMHPAHSQRSPMSTASGLPQASQQVTADMAMSFSSFPFQ